MFRPFMFRQLVFEVVSPDFSRCTLHNVVQTFGSCQRFSHVARISDVRFEIEIKLLQRYFILRYFKSGYLEEAKCFVRYSVEIFSSYSIFIPKTKFKLRNFSEIQKSIRKRSKVSTEVSKQDSKAQRLFQSIWHSTWRSKMFTLSLEILFHPRSDLSTMRLKEHDKKKHESFLQPR